jgi:hypothetical protein
MDAEVTIELGSELVADYTGMLELKRGMAVSDN